MYSCCCIGLLAPNPPPAPGPHPPPGSYSSTTGEPALPGGRVEGHHGEEEHDDPGEEEEGQEEHNLGKQLVVYGQ